MLCGARRRARGKSEAAQAIRALSRARNGGERAPGHFRGFPAAGGQAQDFAADLAYGLSGLGGSAEPVSNQAGWGMRLYHILGMVERRTCGSRTEIITEGGSSVLRGG